jgi:hypothetical protein
MNQLGSHCLWSEFIFLIVFFRVVSGLKSPRTSQWLRASRNARISSAGQRNSSGGTAPPTDLANPLPELTPSRKTCPGAAKTSRPLTERKSPGRSPLSCPLETPPTVVITPISPAPDRNPLPGPNVRRRPRRGIGLCGLVRRQIVTLSKPWRCVRLVSCSDY